MNVLVLHNKYLIGGGEDVSTASEIELLTKHGHTVDTIIVDNAAIKNMSSISLAINTIWSRSVYKMLKAKLTSFRYDIIHVQNFFPLLSPSVFYAAQATGTKVVFSVRNYRLICPNALLFTKNEICNKCVGKKIPYPGVINKCYRESTSASFVAAFMLTFHNFLKTWHKKIDGFICISDFVKEQLILGGLPEEKLYTKANFVSEDPSFNPTNENYYLYVGRLSVEKGIDVMIDAFKQLPDRKLIIIGDGPLSSFVSESAKKFDNISYHGLMPIKSAYEFMSKAKYLIFPTTSHEPFGRTIIEAFSNGTPVIGSNVGGAKKIIENGYNGFVFEAKDVKGLMRVILEDNNCDYQLLRKNARKTYDEKFTSDKNYVELISIYNKVIGS